MVQVTLQMGSGYIEDLKRRMDKYHISQNALAAAMGVDAAQVCRWFTNNPKRKLSPRFSSVEKIEAAMARLTKGRR